MPPLTLMSSFIIIISQPLHNIIIQTYDPCGLRYFCRPLSCDDCIYYTWARYYTWFRRYRYISNIVSDSRYQRVSVHRDYREALHFHNRSKRNAPAKQWFLFWRLYRTLTHIRNRCLLLLFIKFVYMVLLRHYYTHTCPTNGRINLKRYSWEQL